jgi:hypothetical protein
MKNWAYENDVQQCKPRNPRQIDFERFLLWRKVPFLAIVKLLLLLSMRD